MKTVLSILFVLCAGTIRLSAQVRINEVMASNGTTISDEDGDFEDWIELYNSGQETADLSGWGLSDDYSAPFKWVFPEGVSLEPGAFLLVWASGKDRVSWDNAGRWPFSVVVDGKILDTLPTENHGALQGNPEFVTEAQRDGALDFSPSDFVDLNQPVVLSGDFTVAYWFYTRRATTWRALNSSTDLGFSVGHWNASRIGLWAPEVVIELTETFQTNAWEHFTLVRTGTTVRAYRNGNLVGTGTWGGRLELDRFAGISGQTGWSGFDGMIGEVFLLPRALELSEITSLFEGSHIMGPPPLHTNFSISSSGEEIILTTQVGTRVDELEPTAIPRDISIGRVDGQGDAWFFFDESTPGEPNLTQAYTEILDPPAFSHSAGFFETDFHLTLSSEEGVTIYYTLDGSDPGPHSHGGLTYNYKNQFPQNPGQEPGPLLVGTLHSNVYQDPIFIRDRSMDPNDLSLRSSTWHHDPSFYQPDSPVFKGTVVRARAFREGSLPSESVTQTFFISPEGQDRYDLPVISLTIQSDHLFGYHAGLYTAGVYFDQWRLANPDAAAFPRSRANYLNAPYEHPVHMEIFLQGAGRVFHQHAGYRLHGGSSRSFPQKSLRLYARSRYSEQDEFSFDFFPGLVNRVDQQPITTFRRLILRNSGNDHTQTRVRDAFVQALLSPLGIDSQAYRPAVHFINGEFWGLINIRERQDKDYLASHYLLDPNDVTVVSSRWSLDDGSPDILQEWIELHEFIQDHDLSDPDNFAHVEERMDVENFLRYHIGHIYGGTTDWPHNNIRFWRKNTPDTDSNAHYAHDGRWRWMNFDFDASFRVSFIQNQSLFDATKEGGNNGDQDWSTVVLRKLLENPGVRYRFITLMADHMNSSFRLEEVERLAVEIQSPIWNTLPEHVERWPHTGNTSLWAFTHFGANRPSVMEAQMLEYFGLPGLAGITVAANKDKGCVSINTIMLNETLPGLPALGKPFPWTGRYYQTVPVTLQAFPEPGHRFVGWVVSSSDEADPMSEGEPVYDSTESTIELTLTEDTTVEAVFEEIPLGAMPVALHVWDFEDADVLLSPSFTLGGGSLEIVPGPNTEALANTGGDFETQHLRVNNPLGASLTFALPTTGYEQISLDFLTRRSGQGAGLQTLAYTLDGSSWNSFATYGVDNAPPQEKAFDFSAVAGAEDNPDFAVRITFARTQAQIDAEEGLAGNNRFDDVVLSGVALPGTNLPPVALEGEVPVWLGFNFGETRDFDLSTWFEDPDDDPLTFSATVSNGPVLSAEVLGSNLDLTALSAGDAVVTVAANDGVNPPVEVEFRVLVYPAAHVLDGAHYFFTAWAANEPAGSFPPHMIFLQSEVDDPDESEVLSRAYSIAGDAAAGDDPNFPYSATSRTRLNGLGVDGISFINTGRGRDLGAALLVLDTRNVTDIDVVWTAQTLLANTRVYALRLQARTSAEAEWEDVLDDDSPVVYFRDPGEGPETVVGPVRLPSAYEGLETLHLQWRYHHVSGISGPRAQLRLDDVAVVSSGAPLVPAAVEISGLSPYLSIGDLPVLTVRVVNENGILVGDFDGEISLSIDGGTPVTLQALDGVAVFEGLTVSSTGLIGITATADGLAPALAEIRRLRLVDVSVPAYLQGEQDLFGDNFNRIPVAFRFRIEGLAPNATYRYGNRMAHDPTDTDPDDNGAGNFILVPSDGSGWVRSTSAPRFLATDLNSRHAELTADAEGEWEGWVITEPSGNARFTPGNALRPLLILNDGEGGEAPAWFLRSDSTVTVLELGAAAGQGTAVYGGTQNDNARFVALYDETDALLALTHLEASGAAFDDRYAEFYFDTVAAQPGRWGTLIPNNLTAGVSRIDFLDANGDVLETLEDGLNGTVNAGGGVQAIWLPASAEFVFLPAGNGRWDDPNHWMAPGWPDSAGVAAVIPAPLWDDRAVTIPESLDVTVGSLTFANGDFRNRVDGPGTLTFDGNGAPAHLVVTDGGSGFAEFDLGGSVTLVTDLTMNTLSVEEDPFAPEFGALRLRGAWQGPGGLTKTGPGVASLTGGNKDFTGTLLVEEGVLRLTDPATPGMVSGVSVQPGGQIRLVSTGENRVYDFGGGVQLSGLGRNPDDVPEGDQRGILGALRFDPFANDNEAVLPGGVILGGDGVVSIHVDGTRNLLDLSGSLSGTENLSKSGGGTLRLSGSATAPLTSVVANGTLSVNGNYPELSISLQSDGVLSGTGTIKTATGAGTVEMGPGEVLTVGSVSGLSYRFRLQPGSAAPILRLQNDPPFVGGFNAANQFGLYLEGPPLAHPRFGFFSEASADLAALLQPGSWSVYLQDDEGSVTHQDRTYTLLTQTPNLFTGRHNLGAVEGTLLGAAVGPSTYTDWANANFDFGEADGPTDNPFGTGPNLLNYALGLPAGVFPGLADIWLGISENGHLFASFRRDPTLSDVIYIVETTEDLQNWDDVEILYDSSEDDQPNNDFDRMRIEDDAPGDPLRFLRLRMMLDAAE